MDKYLRLYAEPEINGLEEFPDQAHWENVMVIPACNESPEFLRPPPRSEERCLMILVINESVSANPMVSRNNQALAATVQARFELQWQSTVNIQGFGLSLFRDPQSSRDVLLVDRFDEGRKLPVKGGVGHARKIGADLAAILIQRKQIQSAWIHCTDADVQVPETYFSCIQSLQSRKQDNSVLIYPFHHCDDQNRAESKDVILATQLYELSLRYYVAGMKYARSPYAFHTIGSTMAVNSTHYAMVRGFPKREAGEDFYLLNKLAKVGSVLELEEGPDCKPIEIAARRSDRVPFGTGAAVNRIADLDDQVNDFRFYDPKVFEFLRLWLQSLPAIWELKSCELSADIFSNSSAENDHDFNPDLLLAYLQKIGINKVLEHGFRQSKNLDQFTRQLHTWFDAFRTLKMIHALRDDHLPLISYETLITSQIYRQLLTEDSELLAFQQRVHKVIR